MFWVFDRLSNLVYCQKSHFLTEKLHLRFTPLVWVFLKTSSGHHKILLMSSSSSQVDTFWISQKQICYFLFLAVKIKILDQSKTFSEKFISELYGLFIAQRIMISALPVDPWLVIDYCSAIIATGKTQRPAGPLRVIKPWKHGCLMEIHLCIFMLHIIVGNRVAFFHF